MAYSGPEKELSNWEKSIKDGDLELFKSYLSILTREDLQVFYFLIFLDKFLIFYFFILIFLELLKTGNSIVFD